MSSPARVPTGRPLRPALARAALLAAAACALALAFAFGAAVAPSPTGARAAARANDASILDTHAAEAASVQPPAAALAEIGILGLEYAASEFPAATALSEPGARRTVPFSWMFYLVTVGDRRILVDTGFVAATPADHALAESFGIRSYRRPAAVLALAGVGAEAITDVVITHWHFDHIGGIASFPRATLHLQELDYQRALSAKGLSEVAPALAQAEREGRLHLVDGLYELHPQVMLARSGGHTRGSQVVWLRTAERRYVLVGDECYLREACLTEQPLPAISVEDPVANRAFLRRLHETLDATRDVVLTFHDPEVQHGYRLVAPGVVRVR
jgi:N-acyl homoserine lactone hydrolase